MNIFKKTFFIFMVMFGFQAFAKPVKSSVPNVNSFVKGEEFVLYCNDIPFKLSLKINATIEDWKLAETGYEMQIRFRAGNVDKTVPFNVSNDEPSPLRVTAPDGSVFDFYVIAYDDNEQLMIVVKGYKYLNG